MTLAQPTPSSVDASCPSIHFAQFYESDSYLVESLAGYLFPALAAGDNALIIATPEHRDAITRRLTAMGLDCAGLEKAGRSCFADARETLDLFMVDGMPDPALFRAAIGESLQSLTANGKNLAAFGEMVALLWADQNKAAAIRLEDLWNDIARAYRFTLCCGYPMKYFAGDSETENFTQICCQHSHAFPTESFASLDEPERLRAVAALQQKAAALAAEIDRRKQVEAALARRERELSDFLENAVEGLHKVGPDGTILWANQAELDLLGYQRHEYIGHNITEFHADEAVIHCMLEKLLRGENLYDQPARLRCKDGSIRHVLVHSSGYFENGKFVHSRCFTRDITAIKQAEEMQLQLLEKERGARAEAERVSRMKDEFLATLSHELRTPLNAIFGWAQMIMQNPADVEGVREGIAVIDRNTRVQTRLIEDLLDMSRIIRGDIRLEFQKLDLAPVVRSALEAVRPSIQSRQINLACALEPAVGLVCGDPTRLHQIFWNLLANAVKFTPPGGKIELQLRRRGSEVEVSIRDNGQGISADFLPHVFERFRQADSSRSRRHGGLGLGLSIVKQLVEMHGGDVRASSEGDNRGAAFVVTLPVAAPGEESLEAECGDECLDGAVRDNLDAVKMLVVEDDPDGRRVV